MKRLIIHPKDRTTDFLKPIYAGLDATVITGGFQKDTVRKLAEGYDQVIMMGHGSPSGLFACGQFSPTFNGCIVDGSWADILAEKANSVFIWCNADQFTAKHNLSGFFTGMFISEVFEAWVCGLRNVKQSEVDESNERFSKIMGDAIGAGPKMPIIVNKLYGKLAEINPVAKYNHERLYVH